MSRPESDYDKAWSWVVTFDGDLSDGDLDYFQDSLPEIMSTLRANSGEITRLKKNTLRIPFGSFEDRDLFVKEFTTWVNDSVSSGSVSQALEQLWSGEAGVPNDQVPRMVEEVFAWSEKVSRCDNVFAKYMATCGLGPEAHIFTVKALDIYNLDPSALAPTPVETPVPLTCRFDLAGVSAQSAAGLVMFMREIVPEEVDVNVDDNGITGYVTFSSDGRGTIINRFDRSNPGIRQLCLTFSGERNREAVMRFFHLNPLSPLSWFFKKNNGEVVFNLDALARIEEGVLARSATPLLKAAAVDSRHLDMRRAPARPSDLFVLFPVPNQRVVNVWWLRVANDYGVTASDRAGRCYEASWGMRRLPGFTALRLFNAPKYVGNKADGFEECKHSPAPAPG
jgi:hypothetical protein